MKDVFVALGTPAEEAAVIADVLITSDKRGIETHGMGRCKPIYYDRIKDGTLNPRTNFEIVRETPTTAVIDGHNGMGHVIAKRAMQMAIDKAKTSGLGMVVVRNSTHFGIAGYYALQAVNQGCIAMVGTNARPSIAPTFGVDNLLGTNPLTFGFPTDEAFPFLLDCATSIIQRGKVELYERQGKTMPEGWVVNREGQTCTDPKQVLKDLIAGQCALNPLGGLGEDLAGYKGYGYATVVEILSSCLQQGNFLQALSGFDAQGHKRPIELGHFFFAANVEAFCPAEAFRHHSGEVLRTLRNSTKAPGQERIYTAGEKEYIAEQEQNREGGVMVIPAVQRAFTTMRNELHLTQYVFPWETPAAAAAAPAPAAH
eukprot:GAFH01002101.1.p1 GENE.GAFH01002101.1~~GAFH01002101.1.p1  ORF type:complete len:396 (-),score=161.67 GAFH01002101.1:105-1214(-)